VHQVLNVFLGIAHFDSQQNKQAFIDAADLFSGNMHGSGLYALNNHSHGLNSNN
jgi:hypothetical protein